LVVDLEGLPVSARAVPGPASAAEEVRERESVWEREKERMRESQREKNKQAEGEPGLAELRERHISATGLTSAQLSENSGCTLSKISKCQDLEFWVHDPNCAIPEKEWCVEHLASCNIGSVAQQAQGKIFGKHKEKTNHHTEHREKMELEPKLGIRIRHSNSNWNLARESKQTKYRTRGIRTREM
jgi:hypothetical protein